MLLYLVKFMLSWRGAGVIIISSGKAELKGAPGDTPIFNLMTFSTSYSKKNRDEQRVDRALT